MYKLSIENHDFEITDYILQDNLFCIDIEFASESEFKLFINIYKAHTANKDNYTFDYTLEGKQYTGDFGYLLFDANYKIRVYINTKPINHSSLNDMRYDIKNIVNNHELRLQHLCSLLVDKGILSESEIHTITPVYFPDDTGFSLNHEVSNLDTYLSDNEDTIEDIRNQNDNY